MAEVGRATGPLLAAALRALEDLLAARRQVRPASRRPSPGPLPHLPLASTPEQHPYPAARYALLPLCTTCCLPLQHRW